MRGAAIPQIIGACVCFMIYEITGTKEVVRLFENWQDTMIWSCLQGVMGHLYADAKENPQSVMAMLGDFCFFAGIPNRELAVYKPEGCKQDFIIMTADSQEWFALIESVYRGKAKKVRRYAFQKGNALFNKEKLISYTEAIDADYHLQMIDEKLFYYCREQKWSRDLISLYADFDTYERLGLGVVALKNGEPVSGASSYSRYQDGIEIQIDTKEAYRRQGLATACGAKLILACLDRGLYPSWDAQNLWSVGLAEKLGYSFDHEYTAYEIRGY